MAWHLAVAAGAIAFGVQGIDTPTTFDGGRTLGWELDEQVPGIEALYVQVGGGALATSVSRGVGGARLFPVQAEGCAPLRRAWTLLEPRFEFSVAATNPTMFMWPWEPTPTSAAEGILDDVTYDWLTLLEQTRITDGEPIVVPESVIVAAPDVALTHTGVSVSATGAAGLAGLMHQPPDQTNVAAIIFTGSAPDTPGRT
ncbi:MAG: pyridoxal-phosphate dependent enzyme [Acidobacteria bacterium]|nr:pyridoxal-phosphate dependent enzyme [Acidobacteriota bacterium]